MGLDADRIADQLNRIWDSYGGLLLALGGLVALAVLAVAVWFGVRAGRALVARGAKRTLGFGVVQAGVTVAVVTGVYEFFHRRLDLPIAEAVILAVFIEAATWGAVGFIVSHARGGGRGFGDAGPFFWFTVAAGGALAVLGSDSLAVAVGRVVIVALGAYMWYLQLLQVVTRTGQRSRWRWTPRRALLAIGALAPADEDVETESREWQVRRLTRAIARANGGPIGRRIGGRTLARRAIEAPEDVISEAYRRYAAAHLARTEARVDSDRMRAVLAEVRADASGHRADMSATGRGGHADIGPDMSGRTSGGHDVDMGADITPDMSADTSGHRADMSAADTDTEGRTSGAGRTAGSGQVRVRKRAAAPAQSRRRSDTSGRGVADMVRQLRTQHPDMSPTDIARAADVSDRHVRRVLREMSADTSGHQADMSGRTSGGHRTGHVRANGSDIAADMSAGGGSGESS